MRRAAGQLEEHPEAARVDDSAPPPGRAARPTPTRRASPAPTASPSALRASSRASAPAGRRARRAAPSHGAGHDRDPRCRSPADRADELVARPKRRSLDDADPSGKRHRAAPRPPGRTRRTRRPATAVAELRSRLPVGADEQEAAGSRRHRRGPSAPRSGCTRRKALDRRRSRCAQPSLTVVCPHIRAQHAADLADRAARARAPRASAAAGSRCRARPRARARAPLGGGGVPLGAHPRRALELAALGLPGRCRCSSIGSSPSSTNALTPTITRSPDSTCCCHAEGGAPRSRPASSPASIAATAPPSSSTRSISSQRALLELVGQRLDVVGAAERVGGRGRRRPRAARICWVRSASVAACSRRQRERLVERVRVQRLRAAAAPPRAPGSRRGRRCSRAAAPSASSRPSARGSAARAPSGSSRRTARA